MPKKEDNNKTEPSRVTVSMRSLEDEMRESYLNYAMSVIVARALPDVRDGLKPVHRRILYAMYKDLGLRASGKHKKSATVVGEVLGKYHPHGDSSVYDAMVNLAQDFSMRYPLVDGQGNFGSLDGDPAAAYRYTEAKLTPLAEEILSDIDKDTVDFRDNFDGSNSEPVVMPSRVPTLLLNGTLGIAVGMATDIPPHNLTEIINAIGALIDDPELTSEDLTEFVKGPDFPTGGIIYDWKAIKKAYATGKGGIVTRAKTEIVETKAGEHQIIVTEIPYRVNKANLLEKFAELVKTKKIEDIRDLRDESDKNVRIVIDLKRGAPPKKILNQLFKYTQLQNTFHLNSLGLVNGIEPKVLNLKTALELFIDHRKEVVVRRSRHDLQKAKARAHILEGLKKALDHIDKIIATIKKSKDKDEAKVKLMKNFKLSELQSLAILDMRLQSLAGLERKKIEDELAEKKKLIAYLEDLLKSPKKIAAVVKEELMEIKEKYGDERRTQLVKGAVGELTDEDLIPDEETIVQITKGGYVKRVSADTYKQQKRGGKGVIGMTIKEEDVISFVRQAMTLDDILFFTNQGRVFQTKIYELPEAGRTAKGSALVNFLELRAEEIVTAVYILHREGEKPKYLVMGTHKGVIKKTEMSDFDNVRRSGLIAIKLKGDDTLEFVKGSSGKDQIVMSTSGGMAIRFKEEDVRPMGRTASGVRGMKLKKDEHITSMDVVDPKNLGELLVVGENGMGKKTKVSEYRIQGRGGVGIKTYKVTKKTGKVVQMFVVQSDEEKDLVLLSTHGQAIRVPLDSVPTQGRATQGVRLMKLAEDDKIATTTLIEVNEK